MTLQAERLTRTRRSCSSNTEMSNVFLFFLTKTCSLQASWCRLRRRVRRCLGTTLIIFILFRCCNPTLRSRRSMAGAQSGQRCLRRRNALHLELLHGEAPLLHLPLLIPLRQPPVPRLVVVDAWGPCTSSSPPLFAVPRRTSGALPARTCWRRPRFASRWLHAMQSVTRHTPSSPASQAWRC